MEQLLDFLESLRGRPIGTIVYVGAGDGMALDLRRYEALAPQRLLLIEGDPETAAALESRVGHLPWVTVYAGAVAPADGMLRWHRYNLPAFNGPRQADALQKYYPRLRSLGQSDVAAQALTGLLGDTRNSEHIHALAFDVPGQEDELLESIPAERLITFDVLALRGCREQLASKRSAAGAASQRAQRQAFRKKVADNDTQPLWPVTVMRFDPVRHRVSELEAELAAAQDARRNSDARLAEVDASCARLLTQARDAERRAAEHLQQVQQLSRSGEADAALLTERSAQIDDLERERAALDAERREQALALDALRTELVAVQAQLAAARAERDTAMRRTDDADVRARLGEEALAAADAQSAEHQRLHRAALRQVTELEQRVRKLESTHGVDARRQKMLQDELHRAEGQIELIKTLLLGDVSL